MLENQSHITDLVSPVWPIRQVDSAGGNLGGEPEEIQSSGPAGLNSPTEFTRQSPRNLVNIRTQLLIEELAEARVVVNAADDPANLAPLLHSVERRIHSGAASEVQEVARRKRPPSSHSSNSVFSLVFNCLAHIKPTHSARKNTTLFLQMQAMIRMERRIT